MPEPALHLALAAEAARKSSLCWLTWSADGEQVRDRAAWHLWHDGSLLVVEGAGEQSLPGLERADRATVVLRSSDTGARLVGAEVTVEEIGPDDPRWPETARLLLGARLNHGPADETLERWRTACHLVALRLPSGG